MATYVELQVTSHFSFLRGSSSPEELFAAARMLGHWALGMADHGSVAGVVRGWDGQKTTGVRMIPGARVDLTDGRALLLYPTDRAAWSRLTRLLTAGKTRGGKGRCILDWSDVVDHADGLVAILVPDLPDKTTAANLAELRTAFGERGHMALALRRRPDDAARLHELDAMGANAGVRRVATGDVLYHAPEARQLQDVMTAVREKTTVEALGHRRERFMDRNLKSPSEMERRFAAFPDAVRASADIARLCRFDLGEIQYQYPYEEVMAGRTAQEALAALTAEAATRMFPHGLPAAYREQIDHELRLIDGLGYAPYFLTVNAIVQESRRRGILCQGRGSAANSCVCYMLGITSIDPIQHELLFERFVSGERKEPPDIDVDFEHERREEIIQWIYGTYGRHRSALTAVVTRYRTRGAVAEVGKALGLPRDLTKMLTGLVWGWSVEGITEEQIAGLNLNTDDYRLRLTLELARQLVGHPRHLSQHPGGFVLTQDRLDDLVPIEPARTVDRQIIEWDKDDIDALRFMKVDVLGLGMLGCMNRAFNMLEEMKGVRVGMADLQDDDPDVYAMIQKADTLGVFQIESRAQMSMLPRIKPARFYDLVIEVAIVRPGPIQGDMVHPYLRRREGKEKPEYPKPELRAVLEKTLGVPLFQEQAMKVAIVGAGFTPVEADRLRRAMATFKLTGGVSHFYEKLVGGMVARGYPRDFAERTFKQIEGFGSYGFPESHAASFAKITYVSCWMKHHHPDVFCASLLNAQPMGFYAPAQIVRCARNHGVEVRPVSINDSHWDCTLEPTSGRHMAVRLGFRQVRGLANVHGAAIAAARGPSPYESVEEAWRRAGTPRAAIERLAEADAFHVIAEDRRQGLWKVKGLGEAPLPLFAAADEARGDLLARGPRAGRRAAADDGRARGRRGLPLDTALAARPSRRVPARPARRRRHRPLRGPCVSSRRTQRRGRRRDPGPPAPGVGQGRAVRDDRGRDRDRQRHPVARPFRDLSPRGDVSLDDPPCAGVSRRRARSSHIICDRIVDHDDMLRSIGRMDFTVAPGRGDGARNGAGPDPRDPTWPPRGRTLSAPAFGDRHGRAAAHPQPRLPLR